MCVILCVMVCADLDFMVSACDSRMLENSGQSCRRQYARQITWSLHTSRITANVNVGQVKEAYMQMDVHHMRIRMVRQRVRVVDFRERDLNL